MTFYDKTVKVIVLAIGVAVLGACTSPGMDQAQMSPAVKLDNGLGELPHYRDWVDPTGRTPTEPTRTAESTRWP